MSLIKLDRQGRASLRALSGGHELYDAIRDTDGVITLVPVTLVPVSVPESPEILSPEEALGDELGDVAAALLFNEEARGRGDYGVTVRTPDEIHSLVWGDAA